ncbi:MAG: FAD-dependent thymidylate synthase [Candidatus Omnitrophota bacterium]|nr:MAG: FAD-dependent thymidylate synthase [Candidatus Omnitrophota bacterium]
MEVRLLSYTANPKEVIYSSARQCYSKLGAYQIYINTQRISAEKLKEFISHLIKRGHLSPLEHVSFTFAVEGVSRVCTHQLVRHRIASYSQQSQRYVSMDDFQFVVPAIIDRNNEAKTKFLEAVEYIKKVYRELTEILEKDSSLDKEQINQDLRFLIPQASQTKIVITMNVRQLLHFFGERLCLRAQWEIRTLASEMFSLSKEVLPEVFSSAGPKCKVCGGCPENNETCPLYPAALELGR